MRRFASAERRCLSAQARSSAQQRLALCLDSGVSRRARSAAHSALDSRHRNLDGDRCGASGDAISPKGTGLLLQRTAEGIIEETAAELHRADIAWRAWQQEW